MATYIPAIRCRAGDLEYFISTVTYGEAARMIDYVEDVDGWTAATPPELKLQRKLNIARVEREMVPYLLHSDDHFYSALTVEIRPAPNSAGEAAVSFILRDEFPGGLAFGMVTLDGTEQLYALDGQHRLKSIELAVRQRPELAREHISLILVPFRSVTRSQTLFADLNRYAKGPSKSISLLFTHREALARIAKAIAASVPLLRGRVNMESTSLSSNSRDFMTLSTLYETTRTFVGDGEPDAELEAMLVPQISTFWGLLAKAIPEWQLVADGHEHPAYLRQRFLHMHGVAQQALAVALAPIWRDAHCEGTNYMGRLSAIDWQLTNPNWQGIAIHGGRVNNTSTSIRLLAASIRESIGIDVSHQAAIKTVRNSGVAEVVSA